ncbi:MAG: DUF1926 domain-containing protein [Candidatus Omnitrophica bacterium]|nr:DUF1926 domain-containing protein [Candidatus Omnitrophota bacterium]
MERIDFAMVLHFHQPVGNFSEIFERAYQRCYRPFLEFLTYYPDMQMTLHISGSLLEFFQRAHPEIIKTIKDMVSKGQVEIMGGPYYEPILPSIPPRDIKGQVDLMSKAVKEKFGANPRGAWIPERVWNPSLVKYLHRSGARYCVLDDTHLIKAGKKKEDTYGYLLTGGFFRRIAVFFSDKMLRYTIPFKEPRETIEYFKKAGQNGRNPLFCYADDVEKFGEWPGTYDWVYKSGWLKRFFDEIKRNSEWISPVKLTDYLRSHRAPSKIEIPEASYEEMMEWAGGSWFNFLQKYPETGHMYRKMLYVSDKVRRLWKGFRKQSRERHHWANVELYRGECNCGYWHGTFGGLYMYHLRSAIYNHLIAAENIIDGARHRKKEWSDVKNLDFDSDGKDEFIIENNLLSLYLDPKDGGTLGELDYKPICANIIDGLSRKKEPYHDDARRVEPSLSGKLVYDKYQRHCLRDYFVEEDLKMGDFIHAKFNSHGGFSNGDYTAKKKRDGLILERASSVSGAEVKLTKDIRIKKSIIQISYKIENITGKDLNCLFGADFNLTMPFLNSDRYRYFANGDILGVLNEDGIVKDAKFFEIRDSKKELELKFEFSKSPKEIWYFPVETVSKSQIAYRSNFQCSCIFFLWKPDFDKDGTWRFGIDWHIG